MEGNTGDASGSWSRSESWAEGWWCRCENWWHDFPYVNYFPVRSLKSGTGWLEIDLFSFRGLSSFWTWKGFFQKNPYDPIHDQQWEETDVSNMSQDKLRYLWGSFVHNGLLVETSKRPFICGLYFGVFKAFLHLYTLHALNMKQLFWRLALLKKDTNFRKVLDN